MTNWLERSAIETSRPPIQLDAPVEPIPAEPKPTLVGLPDWRDYGWHVPFFPGSKWSVKRWLERRANMIAEMLAWHRLNRGLPGAEELVAPIIAQNVFVVGWPNGKWLKPKVRARMAEIYKNVGYHVPHPPRPGPVKKRCACQHRR